MSKFDLGVVSGEYRWDAVFLEQWTRWVIAPYIPLRDFHVGVTATFVEMAADNIGVGLRFGVTSAGDYALVVSRTGFFTLTRRAVNGDWTNVIASTPLPVPESDSYRLEVTVVDGTMTFAVDGQFAGVYADPEFTGGQVGLSIHSSGAGRAVVDFDDFVYRRKP